MKLKKYYEKYKSVLAYLFFGVCTTLVNIIAYYACAHLFSFSTTLSNCLAWVVSVSFAYITNRLWVFESSADTFKKVFQEMTSFFLCRLFTGFLDLGFMYVFVDLFHFNDMVMKVLSNIIVIIFNYIASKLIIFKKK